jgi:hypothetical protein
MKLAKAYDIPDAFNPDLEQSEFLRPGETLETWEPNPFLKPHADGGRIGFADGLTVNQQQKVIDAFPDIKFNFDEHTYGVKKYLTSKVGPVDTRKVSEDWTKVNRFKKKGFTLEMGKGLTTRATKYQKEGKRLSIADQNKIKAKYDLPEGVKEWDFSKPDQKYGFKPDTPEKKNIAKRMERTVANKKPWTLAADFGSTKGWMLAQMERVWKNEIKNPNIKKLTYIPKYEKINGVDRIIGFTDNTIAGGGKTFYGLDKYTKKGAGNWTKHGDWKLNQKLVDISKRSRNAPNEVITGLLKKKGFTGKVKLNDLIHYISGTEGTSKEMLKNAIVRHHNSGVAFGSATDDLALTTQTINNKIKGIEKRIKANNILPDDIQTLKNNNVYVRHQGKLYGSGSKTAIGQFKQIEKAVETEIRTGEKFKNIKDFKTYLKNSRNKTAAEAQAKLFQKLGINIDDMCSNLAAGGGRIGFATRKCGMELVQSNPDEFIKIAGGEKYKSIYQNLLKESPNKVKSAARGIVKNIRKLGIANPFSWIGGEVWYVGLDTWASKAKGIPLNEALDKAFIFKDFGTTHSNLMEVAKEMGYSDLQLENLQQTLDLSANQQDIERREYSLPGFQKESENWEKLKGTTGLADVQGKMAFDQFKNAEKQLALANEKQDNLWTNYMSNISEQTGKDVSQITDEDINIGFTSAYKVAEDKRRKELIASGKEDYEDKARYVHPYSSGFGEAFYNIWPGNWKQKMILDYSSPEKVAEINKERNYLTWEQLQDPNIPLPKEAMSDLYGRSEDLGYLFGGAQGGRAGYMGGGIAGIRRPNAIPPERQGLRSIMINGKKY